MLPYQRTQARGKPRLVPFKPWAFSVFKNPRPNDSDE